MLDDVGVWGLMPSFAVGSLARGAAEFTHRAMLQNCKVTNWCEWRQIRPFGVAFDEALSTLDDDAWCRHLAAMPLPTL